jgi:hypothetical protein
MPYGLRLIECLLAAGCRVQLLYSQAAQVVARQEVDLELPTRPAEARAALLARYPAVDPEKLSDFVAAIGSLTSADDLTRLTDRFGVRRSDPRFWPLSDAVHAEWRRTAPREAAILDYSHLENH